MSLAYNPGKYDVDLRYLKGLHEEDIKTYKKARFPSNSDEIRIIMQNLVKGYIGNMSNIYNAGVNYVGIDKEKHKKMLRRKSKAMKYIEKLYNYQQFSLMWTYLIDGELYFLPLDASNFYISYSDVGEIDAIIVRSGSFINDQNETLYHFKMWKDGVVYSRIEKEWGYIDTGDWSLNKGISTYKVLPFTIIKDDTINVPVKSTLVGLENEAISGDSFALMSILYSLIIKIMVQTDNDSPIIQALIKELGIMNKGAIVGERDKITTVPQAETDNHMNYKEYVEKLIMFRGQGDGVDKYALFPKTKIESGAAKRAEMGNTNQMRNDRIPEWEEFEDDLWGLMNSLSPVGTPEGYIFAPIPNMIDVTEQADIDAKEWATIQSKWQGGVISNEEYVQRGNPEADEDEVKILVDKLNGADDVEFNESDVIEIDEVIDD